MALKKPESKLSLVKEEDIPDNVKSVDLRNNEITSFSKEVLEKLKRSTKLKLIRLDNNKFDVFPIEFCSLSFLEELHLSGNQIRCLPSQIGSLTNLKKLILFNNKIKLLPEEIGALRSLRTLWLQKNRLACLPSSLCKLSQLNELRIEHNPLISPPPFVLNKDLDSIRSYLSQADDAVAAYTTNGRSPGRCVMQRTFVRLSTRSEGKNQEINSDNPKHRELFARLMFRVNFATSEFQGSKPYMEDFVAAHPQLAVLADDDDTHDSESSSNSSVTLKESGGAPTKTDDPPTLVEGAGPLASERSTAPSMPITTIVNSAPSFVSYFGVYDGHSGNSVPRYLRKKLHRIIVHELAKRADPTPVERATEALRRAYAIADTKLRSGVNQQKLQKSGSTAVSVLISENILVTANVGDGRAVLCRNGRAMRLTKEHTLADPEERQRIEAAEVKIERNRVGGKLNITRSFGDLAIGNGALNPVPHLSHEVLMPDDHFVILATDGLWDVIDDQTAVDIVMKQKKPTPEVATHALIKKAIKCGTSDNTSVVVVFFYWGVGNCTQQPQPSVAMAAASASG